MNPMNTFYEGEHEQLDLTERNALFHDFVQVMMDSDLDRDEEVSGIRPFSLDTSVAIANGEVL